MTEEIVESKRIRLCQSVREHRLYLFMKASLLNYDTDSTSGFDVEQHERLQNTDQVLGTGHYVRKGGREKKEGGG